ncbi:MAG TPA: EAL domain-containing protein [Verrucomicrobiae bacterium]|nr:EAL domain-containing protein [Verrucomicrobiae bacterium]
MRAAHHGAEAELVEKTHELARFTRYLQLLHKLSTTNYSQINALFADYLQTGCEIFGTANCAISEWKGNGLYLRASGRTAVEDPNAAAVFNDKQTLIVELPGELYVGAPILIGGSTWGTVAFWEPAPGAEERLHPQSKEIIELIAKSIGIAIHQRQLSDQLAYQAKHDALTGLPNRLYMQERLDHAIAETKDQGTLAVAFIDLDRFKPINDTLGHGVGDHVLQHIANRLRNCLQPGDTLARMGGDEFTAILTSNDPNQALKTVRKLLAAVRAPCRVGEHELFVTASIGLSFYPRHGDNSAALLRNADSAMYTAKHRGKNDVHCYDAEEMPSAMRRLSLENDLRRALERNELKVLYQPQVELSGKLAGLEVLLVWDHHELGRISPAEFIPIAEETGTILTIGSWVLREACRQVADWKRAGLQPVPVAVNVSALQFAQTNFVPTVAGALAFSGVPSELLTLELTESLVMRGVHESISVMRQIRDLGVHMAIDDFGTGYSSLSYVRELPVNTLKIDGSFLEEMGQPGSSLALIRTITQLGHTFGLSVTAEGVETIEHLQIIQQAGCDHAQGILFGGPLMPDVVENFLRQPVLFAGKAAT